MGKENRLNGWCIIDSSGYPIVTDGKMPVYWLRKIAKKEAQKFGFTRIAKCRIKLESAE